MKSLLITLNLLLISGLVFSQEEKVAPESPEAVSSPDDFSAPDTVPPARMDADGIYFNIDIPAEFPGGKTALRNFLRENLYYPSTVKKKLQGKCYLRFIVNIDGTITGLKVIRGVADCPECDAEAIRVIKLMPKWIPATVDGKKVDSYFNLPITFTLD